MISGAQVRNKTKTRRIRRQKSQTIVSCVTWAKEAHKPDQTDQPSPGTDHLTSGPTSRCTREGRWPVAGRRGRPTPYGRFSHWILVGRLILSSQWWFGMFPYEETAGTDLSSYKRGLPQLSQTLLSGFHWIFAQDLNSRDFSLSFLCCKKRRSTSRVRTFNSSLGVLLTVVKCEIWPSTILI